MESKSDNGSSLLSAQLEICIDELDQTDEPESTEMSAMAPRMN